MRTATSFFAILLLLTIATAQGTSAQNASGQDPLTYAEVLEAHPSATEAVIKDPGTPVTPVRV